MPEDTEESMRYSRPTSGNFNGLFMKEKYISSLLWVWPVWFLYIVKQNSATETFFVIPGGTLGLILHVGFVHLHIFAVTLSLFLRCANSLWQRSLVLLSHCLLTDFTSSPSRSYFSPLCSRNKDSIVLPWQHTHVTWCISEECGYTMRLQSL